MTKLEQDMKTLAGAVRDMARLMALHDGTTVSDLNDLNKIVETLAGMTPSEPEAVERPDWAPADATHCIRGHDPIEAVYKAGPDGECMIARQAEGARWRIPGGGGTFESWQQRHAPLKPASASAPAPDPARAERERLAATVEVSNDVWNRVFVDGMYLAGLPTKVDAERIAGGLRSILRVERQP